MDTIFVKHVREHGPASVAGLNTGDRIISVNGETVAGKSYAHVVQVIQQTQCYLYLLVVPMENDILQLVSIFTLYIPYISNCGYNEKCKYKFNCLATNYSYYCGICVIEHQLSCTDILKSCTYISHGSLTYVHINIRTLKMLCRNSALLKRKNHFFGSIDFKK
jgi:hypothetical protein